jgi:ubiquinone/menaquinone biosynthesis C-methylase UbiE
MLLASADRCAWVRTAAMNARMALLDPSEWELNIARSKITDGRVTFIQGRAQEALHIVDRDVDAVLLCNVLAPDPAR